MAKRQRSRGGTPATVALDAAGVAFTLRPYDHDPRGATGYGVEAAQALGVDPARVLKTLMTAVDGRLTTAIVPVSGQLDLKALARALHAARATMAEVAAAERATGYVAGGISPLGQRRAHPTVLDSSALAFPTVLVSAGRRGLDLELDPADLVSLTSAVIAPIGRAPTQSVVIRSIE